MDCSTPGLPVHHQFPKLAQTHVHPVSDDVQPSHPLSSPASLAFNLPQHQGLFQWSVLHIRWPKYWSFNFSGSSYNEYSGLISFRMDWLDLLVSKGLSRVFSNTTVQKYKFFSTQLSLQSSCHIHTWLLEAGILHIECILHTAYWVQHFPQHHLSGSGIAQLEFYHCREQELHPWQRSWGRRLGTHKGGIEPQESPWKFSSIYPQTRVCLLSALCSHQHLWLHRGAGPHYLSLKKELAYSSS